MADASDIETALVAAVCAALYPEGTANGSVTGGVYRAYRGWPANAALEADLALGISHVSISSTADVKADIPQFPANWTIPAPATPLLSSSVSGNSVTFSGTAATGQLAGIIVNDDGFVYRTNVADTPQSVAAALAAMISPLFPTTVAGAVLTVANNSRLIARTAADQCAILPLRRQRQQFRLTLWCSTPQMRDVLASALAVALANSAFIALPDGTVARLLYAGDVSEDDFTALPMYRRHLTYSAEYTTVLVQVQPSMLIGLFANDSAGTIHLS